jgi:hypothetical protein
MLKNDCSDCSKKKKNCATDGPFAIEREMASRFPCNMTIELGGSPGAAAVHVLFRVVHAGGGCVRRIRVLLPSSSSSSSGGSGMPSGSASSGKRRTPVDYPWWDDIEHKRGVGRIAVVDLA